MMRSRFVTTLCDETGSSSTGKIGAGKAGQLAQLSARAGCPVHSGDNRTVTAPIEPAPSQAIAMATREQRTRARLGKAIGAARRKAGLSVADVAAKLGERPAWLTRSEAGARRLDVVEFFALSDAIGCDGHALLRQAAPR